MPPSVFTEEYKNPVGGDQKKFRDNLRKAVGLLKQAGYEIRGSKMVNAKTGKPSPSRSCSTRRSSSDRAVLRRQTSS
ncbi:MAG: hypothetical protein QM811_03215 [Pirellulales bacterium]